MSDTIKIHKMRQDIDDKYIGFRPQNTSVKPVHISGGAFRALLGEAYNPSELLRLSYVQSKKGKIVHSDETVYKELAERHLIDMEDVKLEELRTFRSLLQAVVGADNGVFGKGMTTFSSASKFFLTPDDLYQDAGEFIGSLITVASPKLKACTSDALNDTTDAISTLFLPVFNQEGGKKIENKLEDLEVYTDGKLNDFIEQVRMGGDCLADNLELQPNKLIRLRQINFFTVLTLIRYLSVLEAIYCGGKVRPLLFDCSGDKSSSIAKASINSVININQSVTRSYVWFFAQYLRKDYSKTELLEMGTPVYEENKKPTDKKSLDDRWSSAKQEAENLSEDECYMVFADALFDMLALEASSHPTNYIRALGTKSGVFYPPSNNVPNKRIIFSNEHIELLVKACVLNTEKPITMSDLLKRLWERFNIIIGGTMEDAKHLSDAAITQADEEALRQNKLYFERLLTSLSLAEIMADGLFQVKIGGLL